MLAKIFKYEDIKNNTIVYLNGPDNADPKKLLELYIEWHNKDYVPFEKLPEINFEDYKFDYSFCSIDFYDDYYKSFKFNEMKENLKDLANSEVWWIRGYWKTICKLWKELHGQDLECVTKDNLMDFLELNMKTIYFAFGEKK